MKKTKNEIIIEKRISHLKGLSQETKTYRDMRFKIVVNKRGFFYMEKQSYLEYCYHFGLMEMDFLNELKNEGFDIEELKNYYKITKLQK